MKPLTDERMLSGADLDKRGISLIGLSGRAMRNTRDCDILNLPDESGFCSEVRNKDGFNICVDIPVGDPIIVIGNCGDSGNLRAVMTPSHGIVSLNVTNMEFPDPGEVNNG